MRPLRGSRFSTSGKELDSVPDDLFDKGFIGHMNDSKPNPRSATDKAGKSDAGDQKKEFDEVQEALAIVGEVLGVSSLRGAYATVYSPVQNTFLLTSPSFQAWLRGEFYTRHSRILTIKGFQIVLAVLQAKAHASDLRDEVNIRIAGDEQQAIAVDASDDKGNIIEVTGDGYSVMHRHPYRFVRTPGMQSLPIPEPNEYTLRQYLEALFPNWSIAQLVLLAAFLICSFLPTRSKPFLALFGPKGSGKSQAARKLKRLIDPNAVELRGLPDNERDLVINANNQWIMLFDNLPRIPIKLSDPLCRISTGGGIAVRKLYTDGDEFLVNVCRPMILTGITDFLTRADLRDRGYVINVPEIASQDRLTETDGWTHYETYRCEMLDALLRCVVRAIRDSAGLVLSDLPRMADAYRFLIAAEPATGFAPGSFAEAIRENRARAAMAVLEASRVASFVLELVKHDKPFEGTATDLLFALGSLATDELPYDSRRVPSTPQHLSNELRRLSPDLAAQGVSITFATPHTGKKITIQRIEGSATVRDGGE